MDEDDRMVARVVVARAKRMAKAALAMGAAAAALSVVPVTGLPLPAAVYGICSIIPFVIGGCAVAGAVTALRAPAGQAPGVERALRTMGLTGARTVAVVAIVLGVLGGLSGPMSLVFMQLA